MATAIQWRRGTTSQHSSFTGLVGEITIDTDLNTVIVHDGSTAGGHRLAKYSEVTSAAAGDISSVVAGNGLSGGATTGDATINLDTTSGTFTSGVQTFLAAGSLAGHIIPATDNTYDLGSSSKMWRDVYVGPGSLYVNGQKVLEDDSGTITVTADANQNLTIKTSGSGDVELNASGTGVINLQSGITVDAGQVLTGTGGLTMGSNINLNSNNINNLANPVETTDAATKAYVDAQVDTADALSELSGDTDDITEGSTNLFFTNARADARVASASDLVRTTGTQTIAGAKTFSDDAIFSGNLTVSGTQTIINTTTASLADNIIELNRDASGTPSEDAGLQVNRGSSADVFLQFKESTDRWQFTNDGTTYFSLPTSTADIAENTNLYYTNARADARVQAAILDSDTMSGTSATTVPSSESVKAYVDAQVAGKDALSELSGDTDDVTEGSTNLYFTNARADARIANAIDTDTAFGSASDSLVPSQLAVKTYVDAQVDTADALSELSGDTDDITEGSSNLFFNNTRARAAISVTDAGGDGSLAYGSGVITYTGPSASETRAHFSGGTGITVTDGVIATTITQYTEALVRGDISVTDAGGDGSLAYNSTTGVITYTGPSASEVRAHITASTGISITDGAISTTITQYADSDARSAISVTDAGGDGSLAYNSTSGVITYTGPSAAETRAHLSAGDGMGFSGGAFAVDSSVVRTSGAQTVGGAKTFSDDMILSGNLTVNGTQTIVNTETLTVDDNMIVLNNNESGTPSEDSGIEVERGTSTNVKLLWSESSDAWQFYDGSSTRTIARTTADLAEQTNLYYTNARADARVANATGANLNLGSKDTDDLSEGSSNLYYTNARADARVDAGFSAKDSDDLSEGSTNLYFTNARARSALSGGTGITYNSSTGAISLTDTGYVTGVTAGTGLSGGGADGTVTLNVSGLTVSELAAGSLQISSESFSDDDTSLMTSAAIQDKIESYGYSTTTGDITAVVAGTGLTGGATSGSATLNVNTGAVSNGASTIPTGDQVYDFVIGLGYTTNVGDITGVTAGTGLSGGGSSGGVTLNVSGLTVSELADAALQTSGESFSNDDTSLMTSAAIEDKILSYGYTTTTGDITAVVAGDGLTGGATSGSATVDVGAGTGITVNANDIAVNMGAFSTSDLSEGTNQYHTSARVNSLIDARVTNSFVDALNVDADTLDGISSASFLRADANDSHSGDITPSSDNAVDLGSASLRYNQVYAVSFEGTATSAKYADLAEKYDADEELEAGTVVCFGGDAEVTACGTANDHRVAGVISTDPAYMMNSDGEGQYVALTGRVPCKVTGPVAKGDIMVSSDVKGHAKADNNAQAGRIIGKAVGSNAEGEGVIEVLVNMM
tara:strand:+ start:4351 stop:8451 length:4101 start_codon:yes stop_codon:yes gene_type:complete